jgi:hypothetical protein
LIGSETDDVKVYTSEGFPAGSDIVHTLEFKPQLFSITPSRGSSAGSVITVTGTGFGVETENLNLIAAGSKLCSQVTIVKYGELKCLTNAIVVAEGATLDFTINSVSQ